MVTFKKGKIKLHTSKGDQEVDAMIGSNGLAVHKTLGISKGSYSITAVGSGLGFNSSMSFTNMVDGKRFIEEADGIADFKDKHYRPSVGDTQKFRKAYTNVRPEHKSKSELEAEDNARRKAEAEKDRLSRQGKENYGHYYYKGGTEKKNLNSYNIHALNRQKKEIANASAEGSKARDRARRQIYNDKHTWLKFVTYNSTRHKFLK